MAQQRTFVRIGVDGSDWPILLQNWAGSSVSTGADFQKIRLEASRRQPCMGIRWRIGADA
jgi:hypothetical protein